jgi:hypothetical protein
MPPGRVKPIDALPAQAHADDEARPSGLETIRAAVVSSRKGDPTVDEKPTRSDETSQPGETKPGASKPADWNRHQMETDDAGEPREQDAETRVPGWNKGEMAEERKDHTRDPLTPLDELDEPAGGLSGQGSNPGGGERWAERDPKK